MKDFEIRCDESRLEKNNTLYGKFSLGPFLPGQGTTFGNALRRSLLSELSGLGITAFEIIGVMQEFSTLPGLRESVLDLSLNLKQIVLTGVLPFATPPIGFLKVRGPAIIYAADLTLPAGVYCAAPKQYIGTLSSNGVLNLKFLVSVGKGHSTQPYSLYRSLSKVKLQPWKRESLFISNSIKGGSELHRPEVKNDAISHNDEWKNSNWKNNSLREYKANRRFEVAEIEKTRHVAGPTRGASLQPSTVQNLSSDMPSSSGYQRQSLGISSAPSALHQRCEADVESTKKKALNSVASPTWSQPRQTTQVDTVGANKMQPMQYTEGTGRRGRDEDPTGIRGDDAHVKSLMLQTLAQCNTSGEEGAKVQRWKGESRSQRELDTKIAPNNDSSMELGDGGLKYVNIQKQTFQRVNPHQVLPIDAVFTPVSQVNFLTQVNDRFETPRENVVLEIWTNGSIHPKRALEEAALSLVQNFDTVLKNIQQASSFHKGLRYSNSFQFFNEQNDSHPLHHKENLIKKTPLIVGKFNLANIPLDQAIYNLDIGNLDISLETFILLKHAKIKSLAHLLKNLYSKEGKFYVEVEEPSLQHNIVSIDKTKDCSEEEWAINNKERSVGGYSVYRGQTKTKGESFCLNEKIIEELSNIFSPLGINL